MTERTETTTAANRDAGIDGNVDRDHLSDVEVGAGCTEIWEHLSDNRAGADGD
jgi:hypothetical protein